MITEPDLSAKTTKNKPQLALKADSCSKLVFNNLTSKDQVDLLLYFKILQAQKFQIKEEHLPKNFQPAPQEPNVDRVLKELQGFKSVLVSKRARELVINNCREGFHVENYQSSSERLVKSKQVVEIEESSGQSSPLATTKQDSVHRVTKHNKSEDNAQVKGERHRTKSENKINHSQPALIKKEPKSKVERNTKNENPKSLPSKNAKSKQAKEKSVATRNQTNVKKNSQKKKKRHSIKSEPKKTRRRVKSKHRAKPKKKTKSRCKSESTHTQVRVKQESPGTKIKRSRPSKPAKKQKNKKQMHSRKSKKSESKFVFMNLQIEDGIFTIYLCKITPTRTSQTCLLSSRDAMTLAQPQRINVVDLESFSIECLDQHFYKRAQTFVAKYANFVSDEVVTSDGRLARRIRAYHSDWVRRMRKFNPGKVQLNSLEFYRINALFRINYDAPAQRGVTLLQVYFLTKFFGLYQQLPTKPGGKNTLTELLQHYLREPRTKIQFHRSRVRKLISTPELRGRLAEVVETQLQGLSQNFGFNLARHRLRILRTRGLGVIKFSFVIDVFLLNLARVLGLRHFPECPRLVCALSKRLSRGLKLSIRFIQGHVRSGSIQNDITDLLDSDEYLTEMKRLEKVLRRACAVGDWFEESIWPRFVDADSLIGQDVRKADLPNSCKRRKKLIVSVESSSEHCRHDSKDFQGSFFQQVASQESGKKQQQASQVAQNRVKCEKTDSETDLSKYVRANKRKILRDLLAEPIRRGKVKERELQKLESVISEASLVHSLKGVDPSGRPVYKTNGVVGLTQMVCRLSRLIKKHRKLSTKKVSTRLGKRKAPDE